MTVDELIEEIKIFKEIYPDAGRLKVMRKSKKGNIKELVTINRKTISNGFFTTQGAVVEFEVFR